MSDLTVPRPGSAGADPAAAAPAGRRGAAGSPRRGPAARLAARTGGGVLRIVLIVVALFWLVPTLVLLVQSLRTKDADNTSGWWTVFTRPAQLTVENYSHLMQNPDATLSLRNTLLISVPTTVLVVLVGALAAYAFAWMRWPGRDVVFLVVVALLVVPIQVAFIPVAKLYGALGIFQSIPSIVLFHTAFGLPFAIYLLRNFFVGIPRDLLEAARMDGAGELTVFVRVIMPLAVPALASLAIFQFLWVWNDLLVSLVFSGPRTQPLNVYLQSQTRAFDNSIDVLAPGAFISMVVPLVVFFAFQRYFVQGLLAGSVK